MSNSTQNLGRYGEDQAVAFLERLGYEIVDRNWRGTAGEIDIISRDKDRIVFVEVKTRAGLGYGHPLEAITAVKLQRMRQLVAEWCKSRDLGGIKVRLDAISVLVVGGRVSFEHLKQVF